MIRFDKTRETELCRHSVSMRHFIPYRNMELLRSMKEIFHQHEITSKHWMRLAENNMAGIPPGWAMAFVETWRDWATFSHSFVEMFWSENCQDVQHLYYGIHDELQHGSMANFFLQWMV